MQGKLFTITSTAAILLVALTVGFMMTGCGGPSQYSQAHQDSYIIQAMDRLNLSPETTARRITGLVKAEIAMGTFTKQEALDFIAAKRSQLHAGASYIDVWGLIQMFMKRYVKSDPLNPVSQAVTIAFYLFTDEISAIPNPNLNIAGPDLAVCDDLLATVQNGVESMPDTSEVGFLINTKELEDEIDSAALRTDIKLGVNEYKDGMRRLLVDMRQPQ